jgi:hypothetical protein
MPIFFFISLQLVTLAYGEAKSESSQNKSPMSADQKKVIDFLKSLPMMLEGAEKRNPPPRMENIPETAGCKIDWTNIDYCWERAQKNLSKKVWCGPSVWAGPGQGGACDLQQGGIYDLNEKRPIPMAFDVANSDTISKVEFLFKFETVPVRKPNPSHLGTPDTLPWDTTTSAVSVEMANGKVLGSNGEVIGNFILKYQILIDYSDSQKTWSAHHSGNLEANFPKGQKFKANFMAPFLSTFRH